jgi:hypothetical protein
MVNFGTAPDRDIPEPLDRAARWDGRRGMSFFLAASYTRSAPCSSMYETTGLRAAAVAGASRSSEQTARQQQRRLRRVR